jgi:hypothetical protein
VPDSLIVTHHVLAWKHGFSLTSRPNIDENMFSGDRAWFCLDCGFGHWYLHLVSRLIETWADIWCFNNRSSSKIVLSR